MYGKLFVQMYEGTLASKGPWEALVTFQQLIILANRHGEVDMTPDAISRRTTIPLEIINKGLFALSERDAQSRSPELEGRRIVLMDEHREWGWKIVNYDKYRKIRSEDERREYQRNLMSARRSKKLAPVSNVSPCSKQYAVSSMQEAEKNLSPTKPVGGSPEFLTFWNLYPRKVDRKEAIRAWIKGVCDGSLGEILAGLESWKRCKQWLDPDKIPYPSTWINKRRWQDTPGKEREGSNEQRILERERIQRLRQ
jgi:hypothetical protein